MCRDDDCGDFDPDTNQMVLELQSSHARHLQIEYQAFRDAVSEGRDKITCRFKSPHTIRRCFQKPHQRLSYGSIVIYDSYLTITL
jgi:hypothetical protein